MGSGSREDDDDESSWMGTVMRLLCLRVVTVAMRNVSGPRPEDGGGAS